MFLGQDCTNAKPDLISRRGLALVPEREKVFLRMSTWENLVAGSARQRDGVTFDAIFELFPRLAERRKVMSGYLSGGERQMLAIAMAMLSNPRLLLIDEFSLGLSPVIVESLIASVEAIRRQLNVACLFVEQSAAYATQLADTIYVMEGGRIVLQGPTRDVQSNLQFRSFYLGMDNEARQRSYRDVSK